MHFTRPEERSFTLIRVVLTFDSTVLGVLSQHSLAVAEHPVTDFLFCVVLPDLQVMSPLVTLTQYILTGAEYLVTEFLHSLSCQTCR